MRHGMVVVVYIWIDMAFSSPFNGYFIIQFCLQKKNDMVIIIIANGINVFVFILFYFTIFICVLFFVLHQTEQTWIFFPVQSIFMYSTIFGYDCDWWPLAIGHLTSSIYCLFVCIYTLRVPHILTIHSLNVNVCVCFFFISSCILV